MKSRWLVLVVMAALLPGCGGGESSGTTEEGFKLPPEPRTIEINLNGYESPEHVGFLMARANDFFEDVGLAVVTGSPAVPTRPVRHVVSETSTMGVSHMPQVAISIDNGMPIVAVGSVISRPTAAMIWLPKSGIESISDLKGRTIAILGLPYQRELLRSVLNRADLKLSDIKLKSVSYKSVPVLASGKADAIFGGSGNVEGARLRALGLQPVVTPVENLGVPPYDELVVFARRDRVAREPRMFRDFLAATALGTAAAVRNPRRAAEEIENGAERDPDWTRNGFELGVEATIPLLSGDGYMDPKQAERMVDWMYGEGMIREKIPVSELLTNAYLPQPGQ